MIKTICGIVAGLMLFVGSASAAVMAPQACVGIPASGYLPTELSGNIVCPQFNLPGTLTAVNLFVEGEITGTIKLTNNAAQSQSGEAETISRFFLGPLSGFTFASPLFTVNASTGPVNLNSGESATLPVFGFASTSLTNNTVFAPYMGGGTFDILAATTTFLLLGFGGGSVTAAQSTDAAVTAYVQYEFDERQTTVPEPATLTMLGIGLVGIGAKRKRLPFGRRQQ